jgi:hypothetical protein
MSKDKRYVPDADEQWEEEKESKIPRRVSQAAYREYPKPSKKDD